MPTCLPTGRPHQDYPRARQRAFSCLPAGRFAEAAELFLLSDDTLRNHYATFIHCGLDLPAACLSPACRQAGQTGQAGVLLANNYHGYDGKLNADAKQ